MALFKPFKITENQLNSLPITAGQLIFTTDTKKIFFDIDDTERIILYSDVINKLDGIDENANNYVLPIASTTLGGVKTTSTKTDLSEYEPSPINAEGVIYSKNSPTITEFNQNTAVFHRGGNLNIPIITGTRVKVSKTQPADIDMTDGDIWVVLEEATEDEQT